MIFALCVGCLLMCFKNQPFLEASAVAVILLLPLVSLLWFHNDSFLYVHLWAIAEIQFKRSLQSDARLVLLVITTLVLHLVDDAQEVSLDWPLFQVWRSLFYGVSFAKWIEIVTIWNKLPAENPPPTYYVLVCTTFKPAVSKAPVRQSRKFRKRRRRKCAQCGTHSSKNKRCDTCRRAFYCNQQCQKRHWKLHKKICEKLNKKY